MTIKPLQDQSHSFKRCLSGSQAFYAQRDYQPTTQRELRQCSALAPSYSVETEHRVMRIFKAVVSTIIFPIIVYRMFQMVAGMILLPSSSEPREDCVIFRNHVGRNCNFKYKRLTIQVDGINIDAMIVGTPSTLRNGRWLLKSNPNGAIYERILLKPYGFTQFLSKLKTNALVFNYPGVGASGGAPNRETMEKAYRAMLTFLEKEIQAKEIIAHGTSMGGGAQAAVDKHVLNPQIKYVFVKDRTFSTIYSITASLTNRLLGCLTVLLGWNIDTEGSSKKLTAPEIIIQTAHVKKNKQIHKASQVADDGLIPAKNSLAQSLLAAGTKWKNKVFIGVKENHFTPIKDTRIIVKQINKFLS